MSEVEGARSEVERRIAAGRVATWFNSEIGSLLETLRSTVARAPARGSTEADQDAAARILAAARACSTRVSVLLGLRAEPPQATNSNLGRELRAVLSERRQPTPEVVVAATFDAVDLPLSVASLRSTLGHLLDNAIDASAEAPELRAAPADSNRGAEVWVVNRGALEARVASRAPSPFYTTKPGRRGLGLSLVHIAADNQGGRLEIVPGLEETRVGLVFPRLGEAPAARAESDASFACHLAAGLAHDVNNALMAALGWAEILGDARDEAERQEALATLTQAADYLEAMSYLLPYDSAIAVGAGPLDLGPLDLAQAFERMRPLLRAVLEHKADRKIALHLRSVPGAKTTMSEDALRSLVLRLAENARDAMPKGGTWTIACDVRSPDLLLTLSAEVRGTDLGASAPHLSSSKPHGREQTALGLAVARDLVAAAGGTFEDDPRGPPLAGKASSAVRIRLPGPSS
jgi:signal transduction histidine kinase